MSNPKKLGGMKLLGSAPVGAYKTQIVRYPFEDSGKVARSFYQATERLAATFRGNPEDDSLLLPYLSLTRQAFELELKHLIATLARYRQTYIEGPTAELSIAQDPEHLRATYGHNLHKLLSEVERQYAALRLLSPFPKTVRKVILAFHEDDTAGVAFRYAGQLPEIQEHADFPTLHRLLAEAYDTLSVLEDYVDGTFSAAPTVHDLIDDFF
jgi:hypothetical protein